jgi:hypothetical protein
MDCAEVLMACMYSNRSCPYYWCSDSSPDETDKNCKYLHAADVLSQVDLVQDQLLEDNENVLLGREIMSRRLKGG